jgi:DNA polymerase III delta subunit
MSIAYLASARDDQGSWFQLEARAKEIVADAAASSTQVQRVYVPDKGSGGDGSSPLRPEVGAIIPALQSFSLFGDQQVVELIDPQNLLKAEAEAIAGLLANMDAELVLLIVMAKGKAPAVLDKALMAAGAVKEDFRQVRQRDAAGWLTSEARRRRIGMPAEVRDELFKVFGTDLAAISSALDQLDGTEVTLEAVKGRFKNRPDLAPWDLTDAMDRGDVAGSLRLLSDYLIHSHPLQLVGFLERDLRRKSLALSADSVAQFAEWEGARPDNFAIKNTYTKARTLSHENLAKALSTLEKVDGALKHAPEATHLVLLERLVVAFCFWYR